MNKKFNHSNNLQVASPIKTKKSTGFFRVFSITLLFVLLGVGQVMAATITSTTTGGDWAAASTWVGGAAPNTADNVIIVGPVVSAATITQTSVGSVTINSNGSFIPIQPANVNFTFGALTVNSGGTITMYKTYTILGQTSISGTINFGSTNKTVAMTFTGDVTLNSGAVWNETNNGAAATFAFAGSFTNNATTFTAQNTAHGFSGTTKTLSGSTATVIPTATFTGAYTNSGT